MCCWTGAFSLKPAYPLGSGSTPELFLVYSDGSGVESYRCDHGKARWGGQAVGERRRGLHARSFAGAVHLAAGARGARRSAACASMRARLPRRPRARWLVSARAAAGAHYALKLWKPGAGGNANRAGRSGENLVEPVLVAPRNRPKRHPSGLHDWNYANLLALDARQSREGDLKDNARIGAAGDAGRARARAVVTGTAPVEADGSFFCEGRRQADSLFRLLDAKGAVVRQEHGWFWIRRGEQRICVGLPHGARSARRKIACRPCCCAQHAGGSDRHKDYAAQPPSNAPGGK
jgi:hypothetical protein